MAEITVRAGQRRREFYMPLGLAMKCINRRSGFALMSAK